MMNTYSKMNKKDDDKKELPRNKKNIVFAGISVRGELKFLVSIYFQKVTQSELTVRVKKIIVFTL